MPCRRIADAARPRMRPARPPAACRGCRRRRARRRRRGSRRSCSRCFTTSTARKQTRLPAAPRITPPTRADEARGRRDGGQARDHAGDHADHAGAPEAASTRGPPRPGPRWPPTGGSRSAPSPPSPLAASALPALKPYQPTHSMPRADHGHARVVRRRQIARKAVARAQHAGARPARTTPAVACTTSPPAKSITCRRASQPPPQTQWHTGA